VSRVAVCCSVLQCVAVCCSALQCVAACCSVLQGVLQCRKLPTSGLERESVAHTNNIVLYTQHKPKMASHSSWLRKMGYIHTYIYIYIHTYIYIIT